MVRNRRGAGFCNAGGCCSRGQPVVSDRVLGALPVHRNGERQSHVRPASPALAPALALVCTHIFAHLYFWETSHNTQSPCCALPDFTYVVAHTNSCRPPVAAAVSATVTAVGRRSVYPFGRTVAIASHLVVMCRALDWRARCACLRSSTGHSDNRPRRQHRPISVSVNA